MSYHAIVETMIPFMSEADFEDAATSFLAKYCPEALRTPMAVPIVEIARKMGLTICADYHLSEDCSILGMICFTQTAVPVYFKETDEFRDVTAKCGTIFIDADLTSFWERGRFNFSVAHECSHWTNHRLYHMMRLGAERNKAGKQCILQTAKQKAEEKRMERQADAIAARILMPTRTFPLVVEKKRAARTAIPRNSFFFGISAEAFRYVVIEEVADFFAVSKQAVEIRLKELNIDL